MPCVKTHVRLTGLIDLSSLQVIVELVLSFLISLVGVLLTSGEFLPIRSSESLYSR